jgi:hypothetical protein
MAFRHGGAARYGQALPLYQQAWSIRGEANCIKGPGEIALARSDLDSASARFEQALSLCRAIPERASIGRAGSHRIVRGRISVDVQLNSRH